MLRELREVPAVARFATGLWGFLRRPPLTVGQAREILARRLAPGERERAFLAALRRHLEGNRRSPYRRLLELGGCELGDVERLLAERGLEATLAELRRADVYVTFEEFKGREPIVRQGREVPTPPGAFDNPHLRRSIGGSTGGSTGAGTRVALDLDSIREAAPVMVAARAAQGILGLPCCVWRPTLPSLVGMYAVLHGALVGDPPERWFSPVTASDLRPSLFERWATRYLLVASRLAGRPLPRPEPVPLDDPGPIVRWAHATLVARGACVVRSTISGLLRLAQTARALGLDFGGAIFSGGGEPATAAKVAGIRACGARFLSTYASTECGVIGVGCTAAADPTDVHFLADGLALIQYPRPLPGVATTVDALHFTTLLPSAPKLLINAESDDFGVVEERRCGCPVEALGLRRHIRQVSSFRKLTGEGMTLVGNDVVHIIETVLPARFGGTPFDYQLVESEDDDGFTRLYLRVHPRLAIGDDRHVVAEFLDQLRQRGGAAKLGQAVWGRASSLRVRREAPLWTAAGKFLPFQPLGLRWASQSAEAGRAVEATAAEEATP